MAITKASSKAQAAKEVEVAEVSATPKQLIDEGIQRVIDSSEIATQHFRYKAMRAIAYQAFLEAVEAGDFEALVERAIDNIDELPAGWTLERATNKDEVEEKPAVKKPASRKPVEKAAPSAPKAQARRRPVRKSTGE